MALDPVFEDVVNDLIAAEKAIADGTVIKSQRPWMDFQALGGPGKFDFNKVNSIFTRDPISTEYAKLRSSPTSVAKDVQALKLASDFLAGMERDYRMRHRSRIRSFTHAAVRAQANGVAAGPLRRNTIDFLTRVTGEDQVKKDS